MWIALLIINGGLLIALILVLLELRRIRRPAQPAPVDADRVRELEDLLAAIPDPLVICDRAGNWLDEYPAANKTRARGILDHLAPVDRAKIRAAIAEAIDQQTRMYVPFRLGPRMLAADIWPVHAAAEANAAAVCVRDVSAQAEHRSELEKLAARNRAILRSAMDGFFVVDESYRFQDVNDAFCRMLGYSVDELLRMKITDIEVTQPEQPGEIGSPLRTGLHQFATAYRHRDGHIIQLETSVFVLRDDDAKLLVGFARDVTERRRAEEALEQLSRQNKLILDSAAEGIFGVDVDGRFSFANPAAVRLLGWDLPDLLGVSAHHLIREGERITEPEVDRECSVCLALSDGSVQHVSLDHFVRRDGEKIPVECVSSPIRERGKVTGAVVVFRDISERIRMEEDRRQLEARVQQTQKLESLGMLAGGLAHDFNNLLLSVVCNASLATEAVPEDTEVRKYLEKIVKAGRRASDLTRQMLAYSGQAKYELQPLALNDLVDELSDLLRAALPKSVHLDLQLESGLPMVEADSAQFQQVIMNLLINSAEAIGHEPGTVTIRTSTRTFSADELGKQYIGKPLAAGTYACLEVRDTGPGIPPETLSRIFEPFFTTKTTGRGLGLSALLGIVRSHNGAVHVESQAGVGTTFTIVLPPMTSSKPVPPSRQFNSASLPEGSTVLVVDDEEDIRDVVQAVLESRGAHVITASDGPAGIEQFREHADDVDVVLLDMTMPGLGGDAVFREIMSIKPDARVIISSGYSEQDTLARLDDKRLAGFVHKPYTAQLLIDEINTALLGQSAS